MIYPYNHTIITGLIWIPTSLYFITQWIDGRYQINIQGMLVQEISKNNDKQYHDPVFYELCHRNSLLILL